MVYILVSKIIALSALAESGLPCRLFLSAGAYLGIGAYYNYSNYGSTGWDLVPYVTLL